MGIYYYTCCNCERTFPDCASYVNCKQCNRKYCNSKCANMTYIDSSSEEYDEEDDENNKQCGVCAKTIIDYHLLCDSLLKHFKITKDDALQIWRDDKED